MADKRRLQDLLHQQLWCWGMDVRSTPNWLATYGGIRCAGAVGTDRNPATSHYVFTFDDGVRIVLWPFGVAICDDPCGRDVFVHRYQRGVRILPAGWRDAAIASAESLPRFRRPAGAIERRHAAASLGRMLKWIEAYERWIALAAGPSHRHATLVRWEHPVATASEMADTWRTIRERHDRLSNQMHHGVSLPIPRDVDRERAS